MTDKRGTSRQRRATLFKKAGATGTSQCPFKTGQLAIVPMRYALDRSRHDPHPEALTPLPASGQWKQLPALKSRRYTLRQLRDGYVYVFDETAGTLHEYVYSAMDASLSRIVWTDAHLGQDERSGEADGQRLTYLLYPQGNTLHMAYAPAQWTWRICEHMRSNADSRAQWMKRLDLASYCATMAEPHALPLSELARAVADIDPGQVNDDGRFEDTFIPSTQPATEGTANPAWVPLAADVHWLGSVPDSNNALFIALDDPLAVLNDLGMQLAADQAAWHAWQNQHEHRLDMATLVTRLCGVQDEPQDSLPAAVRGDPAATHGYLLELEDFLRQYELEAPTRATHTLQNPYDILTPRQSDILRKDFTQRHGVAPSGQDINSWMERRKWRREIDLEAARRYCQQQHPLQQQLLEQVRISRNDLQRWALHIGVEPLQLFIDTGNPRTLLYLQTTFEPLLAIMSQNDKAAEWLIEQEKQVTTLFSTLRYGFSPALKEALHSEAGKLLNGLNDYTNLATRIGELNTVLNHQDFINAPWMKALKQPAQDTFKAMKQLAGGTGQRIAQSLLNILTPMDSRLAKGRQQNLQTLISHMLIGHVLSNSPHKLAIDSRIAERVKAWKEQRHALELRLRMLQQDWLYPRERGARRLNTQKIAEQQARLRAHEARLPLLMDYQNNQYTRLFRQNVHDFMASSRLTLDHWKKHVKMWLDHMGPNGLSVGWGVTMLNFINSAMIWEEVSRDGSLSKKDLAKIGYSIAWSFNLLMALYVEVPWGVVRNAQPVVIDNKNISILSRSSAYWKARGNTVWAEAVGSFRTRLLATGLFAVGAAWLELWDLHDDWQQAKTDEERKLIGIKMMSVVAMGGGGILQITALFSARVAAFVMTSWFAIGLLAVGLVYLLTTLLINELKQDSIGAWLSRCCWSRSDQYRYPDTPEGHQEEKRALQEIILSPQVTVKRTFETGFFQVARTHAPVERQNGAWIQIRLPAALRDHLVLFELITSKRTAPLFSLEPVDSPKDAFLENGRYKPVQEWGRLSNHKPYASQLTGMCTDLPASDDVIWHTWIPVTSTAGYVEMQIWYPHDVLKPSAKDAGYLYQLALESEGETAADGLSKTELLVKRGNRDGAWNLYVQP